MVTVEFLPELVSKVPLPSRSHSYLAMPPSASVELLPLKVTVWFGCAGLGEIVNEDVGGCGPEGGSSVTSVGVPGWTPISERML